MVNWTNSLVTGILTDDSNLHKTQTDTGPAVPIPGTTWIGGYKIGQGGFGFITLWVLIEDATRAPLNQVIIKDFFDRDSTLEEGPYTGVYDDLVRKGLDFGVDSTRPIGSAQVFYRFCKEAYLQGIMTEPDQDKQLFSVPLWGYASKPKLNDTNKIYNHWRLYMPLYDYGDLSHLIHQHQFMKKAIPEPFLWHTLICLVTAALQMEEQARKLPNSSDSDVIIVFDIKPQNILLAPPGGDTFPVYPRPHLADLGGGFLSNDQDMDNIHNNQGFCFTRGYLAPEMSQAGYNMNNDARFSTQRLRGSHTNIWQIGRVLQRMMTLQPNYEMSYSYGAKHVDMQPDLESWTSHLPNQNYSRHLRHVVTRCLRFDPIKRPTPRDILDWVSRKGPGHYQNMDVWGTPAWIKKQQEYAGTVRPSFGPQLTPRQLEADEKRKAARDEKARLYLRAWKSEQRDAYQALDLHVPDALQVEYSSDLSHWATEDTHAIKILRKYVVVHPLTDSNGGTSTAPLLAAGSDGDDGDGDVDDDDDPFAFSSGAQAAIQQILIS